MRAPTDPAAAALQLLTELPRIVRAPARSIAAFQDFAGILQLEGVLDGMDFDDAGATVAAFGVDLMCGGLDRLLTRAAWIRSGDGAWPLHEPERVAVALERIYTLVQLRSSL
jgi:hypothetical protein